MLENIQSFVAIMSALIGGQPTESGRVAKAESVTKILPAVVARRKIVAGPGSTAFFAKRVSRGRMH
jgi:hypothetical protein